MITERPKTKTEERAEKVGQNVGKFWLTLTKGSVILLLNVVVGIYHGVSGFGSGFKKGIK